MKEILRKSIKFIISAALAVLLLWFSFSEVDWTDFTEGLKSFRWEFIALSMAAGAFSFWLRGLRWRMLLLPIDPATKRITTFNGINIASISNFVLPRIGEFVRCGVITRRTTATYDKVLGTVVLERGWELLVMMLMLLVVIFAGFDRFGSFFIEKIWTPVSAKWWLVLIAFVVLVALLYVARSLREKNAVCAKVWGVISGLIQGFTSCFKMERKWLFFAYTLLIWLVYWVMAASILWASTSSEFAGLNMIDALFLSLVGGIGFAIPVPGGIGAFHFVIQLALFEVYGIPEAMGLVYATVSHTSQAITQILFGLFSYGYEALKK